MDFAGVHAVMTARGTFERVILEKGSREERAPLDDRKDVISKPRNEQHLFTKRPKY
jgi:hypothetical protein